MANFSFITTTSLIILLLKSILRSSAVKLYIVVQVAIMLSFSSCTETEFDDFSSTDWQLIKISLELPTANSPYTYALSTTNENAVESIDILLFDSLGKY